LIGVYFLYNYFPRYHKKIFHGVQPANMLLTSNFTFALMILQRDGAHLVCRNTTCLHKILHLDASKQLSASVHIFFLFVISFLIYTKTSHPFITSLINVVWLQSFCRYCNKYITNIYHIVCVNNSRYSFDEKYTNLSFFLTIFTIYF
jgi:hypothetical protein